MNDSQKIAYLMGMAKFAQDNDINFDSFVKVAVANWARAGTAAARNAISDVSGAVRKARNAASQGGFMAGARDLGRRFTNTVGDALGTAGSRTRAARITRRENMTRRARPAGDQTPRQSVDNVQATNRSAARRNLAVGGVASLYGLGVANNAQQAVRGAGKYNPNEIPLWNRIMMFLGLQDRPSRLGTAASVLNPFTSGFRRYRR